MNHCCPRQCSEPVCPRIKEWKKESMLEAEIEVYMPEPLGGGG